ncbi:MAG: glycosyltransferase family 39 protein [Planctomycetota bacterium]|jgi:hypothetical protein
MIPGATRESHVTHLLILLSITVCIGIYLICTTVLIAGDGVTYIEYAQRLAVSPANAMRSTRLHPGYSSLVGIANKLVSLFYGGTSFWSWMISAQGMSLLCRVIAMVELYLIGCMLVGRRTSFWAVMILAVLPLPARYGSDALSDWPHIAFLALGFYLLLLGAEYRLWWIFGFAGITAGAGYLVRPECCQLVMYGAAWLVLCLVKPQVSMSRARSVPALLLLLAGFAITAGPYMNFKGYVFPESRMGVFPQSSCEAGANVETDGVRVGYVASLAPAEIGQGVWKLVDNILSTLMYYFAGAAVIGIWRNLNRRNVRTFKGFFLVLFVLLNVTVMLWLYFRMGYMSRRHTLPLVLLVVFPAAAGLRSIADGLAVKFSREGIGGTTNLWLFILFMVGVMICTPKLLRPMRIEKGGYRTAAKWLSENTAKEAIIAVPDRRLNFYAEREGPVYDEKVPERVDYVVKVLENDKEDAGLGRAAQKEYSGWVDERKKSGKKLAIYRML